MASCDSLNTGDSHRPQSECKNRDAFNYDHILEHLGQLGKFQMRSFLLLCVPAFFPGIIVMSYIFTGGLPDYRCYIQGCDDENSVNFSPEWLNNTVPITDKTLKRCYQYNNTWTSSIQCFQPVDDVHIQRCSRNFFDTSTFQSTIVTEFQLTCDDEWKQPIPNVVYMVGMLIGAGLLGTVADRKGRRMAFTVNLIVMACVVTGSAFSPDWLTFCILRFFCGVCAAGHFDVLFVWGIEAVGKNYRIICGFVYQIVFTLGSACLGIIAYFARDWRMLQLIIGAPLFLVVSCASAAPESTRWLIAKERYVQARQLILKAAKINKKIVPPDLLLIPCKTTSAARNPMNDSAEQSESIMDVCRSAPLVRRLAITATTWIAVVMSYYGITYSANNLASDFYLNYELNILVEIPAYVTGIFAVDKIGRRPTLSLGLIISGLSCLVTGVIAEDLIGVRIAFSLTGKYFVAGVYAVIYSYSVELFPTSSRSATVGLCSMSGRIGGIVAPLIADAGRRLDPALPYIVFASVNVAVGILCLLLPETNHRPLPVTIEEAIHMESNEKWPCLEYIGCSGGPKKTTSADPLSPSSQSANEPS